MRENDQSVSVERR